MLESKIQSAIAKKLRQNGYLVNTYKKPPGWPDISAFKDGKALFIEVKQPGKEPTPLQFKVMTDFIINGFDDIYTMDSVKDLTKLGII